MSGNQNTKGIVLMLLSMVSFALADTLVKFATSFLSPAQVLFYLMGGGLVMFAAMAKAQGETLRDSRAFKPIMLLRYTAEVAGMIGMVMSLNYVPLSTVGAITQAAPIVVAVGAVVFLSERVSWRRWTSILVGFAGVLCIVQPGGSEFDLAVLWAVLALLAFSVRDLTTRMVPDDMPSTCLATYTMIAAVPFAVAWVFLNSEVLFPANINWLVVAPMILLGSIGYMLLIASMRIAPVSVVMPFRYSRIIFLLILGVIVFDERPSIWMLFGASLIILSGVYMMWRERQLKQLAQQET